MCWRQFRLVRPRRRSSELQSPRGFDRSAGRHSRAAWHQVRHNAVDEHDVDVDDDAQRRDQHRRRRPGRVCFLVLPARCLTDILLPQLAKEMDRLTKHVTKKAAK